MEVERLIRERIGRGRVECSVRAPGSGPEQGVPVLDEERALQLHREYLRVAELLGLDEKPGLSLVASAEGVIGYRPDEVDTEQVRDGLQPLLGTALDAATAMRLAEGGQLLKVIEDHLETLEGLLSDIRSAIPEEQRALHERTVLRIRALAAEVSEERLVQELAILAERADVTEELSRLTSHLIQFRALLGRDGSIGRELDFLLQEMNREVNTLCSKLHSAPVVRQAVAAKAELEKIREQIQNVE